LKGGTRKIDKEERNRRKNEGERAREKNMTRRQVKAMRLFSLDRQSCRAQVPGQRKGNQKGCNCTRDVKW
jgi:hypothetical protein